MLILCLFDYVICKILSVKWNWIKYMINNVYVVFFKIDMLVEFLLLVFVNLVVLNFFYIVIFWVLFRLLDMCIIYFIYSILLKG